MKIRLLTMFIILAVLSLPAFSGINLSVNPHANLDLTVDSNGNATFDGFDSDSGVGFSVQGYVITNVEFQGDYYINLSNAGINQAIFDWTLLDLFNIKSGYDTISDAQQGFLSIYGGRDALDLTYSFNVLEAQNSVLPWNLGIRYGFPLVDNIYFETGYAGNIDSLNGSVDDSYHLTVDVAEILSFPNQDGTFTSKNEETTLTYEIQHIGTTNLIHRLFFNFGYKAGIGGQNYVKPYLETDFRFATGSTVFSLIPKFHITFLPVEANVEFEWGDVNVTNVGEAMKVNSDITGYFGKDHYNQLVLNYAISPESTQGIYVTNSLHINLSENTYFNQNISYEQSINNFWMGFEFGSLFEFEFASSRDVAAIASAMVLKGNSATDPDLNYNPNQVLPMDDTQENESTSIETTQSLGAQEEEFEGDSDDGAELETDSETGGFTDLSE